MKKRGFYILEIIKEYRDDLKYLFFVGLPTGILLIILSICMDYTNLF